MKRPRFAPFGWIVALLLAGGLLAPLATTAQESDQAAGLGEIIRSPTRAEFKAELQAAFAETDEPAQNTEGIYVVGAISDLQSLNPFLVESSPSIEVVGLIYESLFGGDPRTGEPAPAGGLADSWEIAADGLTYTFHLNRDAKWHDGVDVTAEDVAFSLEALADPATASAYTGAFVEAVASWNVIDEHTIEIVATEVRFSFLYDIQGVWILPKHIWENVPRDQWAIDPGSTGQDPSRIVGTGPYKFDRWVQGQEVRLTRNEDYYDDRPNIKEYVFRIFPDSEALFNAFLDGQVDVIGLEPEQVQIVEGTPGLEWTSYPERGFVYYEFNLDPEVTTLFQDRRVRQAFMYALDRQAIVDNILLGFGEVAHGTHPSISPAYAPDQIRTRYGYDPARARELLAEAGWTDTNGNGVVDKDGEELSFEFLYAAGSATTDSLVAYLQDAWRQVGIEIQPRALEFPALIEATTTNPTFKMALYGFSWDATFIQDVMFGCEQYQVGFNDMKYCNPELDEIHRQAKREFDEERRRALLIEAANIVNDDQPVGVIYFSVGISAWNERVHNYRPSAWGNQSYVGIWIEE